MTYWRWLAAAACCMAPAWAGAAELDGGTLSLLWGVPFAGILLSIALMPLLAPVFWHHHFGKVAAAWALAFLLPFALVLSRLLVSPPFPEAPPPALSSVPVPSRRLPLRLSVRRLLRRQHTTRSRLTSPVRAMRCTTCLPSSRRSLRRPSV